MPKFLLQESHYAGTYSNPFKYQGKGVKYSKWVTVRAAIDQRQAELLWQEFQERRDQKQLQRYRVVFGGKVIVNPRGSVYASELALGGQVTHMRFVKKLPGGEL